MGENAIDISYGPTENSGVQYLHTKTWDDRLLYVAFKTSGTTIEPPPLTGVTEYRLGVVYYGQTTNAFETRILFSDETLVSMETPDADIYYFGKNPIHVDSQNLPAGVYTTAWSGSTAGASSSNGALTDTTSSEVGLTQVSHIFSNITTSGTPSATISAGEWSFNIRARVNTSVGVSSLNWNVYKSAIIDTGSAYEYDSDDVFLFSGSTGALTTSYVDYTTKVTYESPIVFP